MVDESTFGSENLVIIDKISKNKLVEKYVLVFIKELSDFLF